MFGSARHRAGALAIAGAAVLLTAVPAAAVSPSVESSRVHIERPFVDCPGFGTVGVWDVDHKLTTFFDANGVAIRDTEAIEFGGWIVNARTGARVADSGARKFFDTLAPDGSFLTTYSVEVRHSRYVHVAGRIDWQSGRQVGVNGFDDDGIAALCGALGG